MPDSSRLVRFATLGGVIATLMMLLAVSCQPQYLGEAGAPSTESQSKTEYNGANGARTVTCEQDCQVHFGPREYPKPDEANDGTGNSQTESNSRQYTREGLDLLAQRRMAYWAIWLAGFTLVGLVLLAGTLWEAFEGAKAARAAVIATEKVGEKTVQAYLMAKGGKFSLKSGLNNQTPTELIIQLAMRNLGQSPAKRITYEYEVVIFKQIDADIGRWESAKWVDDEFFCADIGPGSKYPIRIPPIGINSTLAKELNEKRFYIDVQTKFFWRNEFGNRQEQEMFFMSDEFTLDDFRDNINFIDTEIKKPLILVGRRGDAADDKENQG